MNPESIRFVKAEANGNDFLIVDADVVPPAQRSSISRRLCDRHRGVGADGVEFVRTEPGQFVLTLFNADGTEAEISGNGTRCVAAFYARRGFRHGFLQTRAGRREARVLDGEGEVWTLEIDMGEPQLQAPERLVAMGRDFDVTVLSMGNPQCVVRVEEFAPDWEAIGAALTGHPRFPQRTNVEFLRVLDRSHLEIRIFERGVGPTRSSGTGSCAAAAAAIAQGWAASPVQVAAPGGSQRVVWAGAGQTMKLIGTARIVAEGLFFLRLPQ